MAENILAEKLCKCIKKLQNKELKNYLFIKTHVKKKYITNTIRKDSIRHM